MKDHTVSRRFWLPALLGMGVLCLLFAEAEAAAAGVRRGLRLCTDTLLPTLFPFLVLSDFLVTRRAGELLKTAFSRPVAALFGISEEGAAALLLGVLCGSPVASASALTLYRSGRITKAELHRLSLFANNAGCGFLVGAVGGALFGSTEVGVMLFLVTWLAALAVGFCIGRIWGKVPRATKGGDSTLQAGSLVTDLTGSVSRGFASLLQIFAFVLFFSCLASCVSQFLARAALPKALPVLLHGLLEMTAGIGQAAELSPAAALRFTAFFAGFGGLSVCLQIFSLLEGTGARLCPYLLARTAQGLLGLLFCELYLRLRCPILTTTSDVTLPVAALPQPLLWAMPALLLALMLLSAICNRIGSKKA